MSFEPLGRRCKPKHEWVGGICSSCGIPIIGTLERRVFDFWRKVDKNGEVHPYKPELGRCWMWKGAVLQTNGYGECNPVYWPSCLAHRIAWSLHNRPAIPQGLELDHTCYRKLCVNPDHLDLVTHQVNILRKKCPKGHLMMKTRRIFKSGVSREDRDWETRSR